MDQIFRGLHNALRRAQIARARSDWAALEGAAHLELATRCPHCADGLHALVAWWRLRDLGRLSDRRRFGRAFRPTATVVVLDAYPTFDDWRKAVSRETNGKYHRSANKARRLGFSACKIGVGSYSASLYAIRASKKRRSKGDVWEAGAEPALNLADARIPLSPPACNQHWRIDWGVLQRSPDGLDRMVAFASLLRVGNSVQVSHFIGHGDHLADGVTKLLQFEIMDWLLSRNDACVHGVDYLIYGTLEEGNEGLRDWKRYMKFAPALIDCVDPPTDSAPANFDRALYLELNPDVAAAGVDPLRHYMLDGMLEGRPVRRHATSEDAIE